jgi:hypothetical protein
MKSHSRIAVIALPLLLSAAGTSMAQSMTNAQAFAAQIEQYQSLSGTGPAWNEQPVNRNAPDDPVANESFGDRFARMQAESSKSSQFQPHAMPRVSATAGGWGLAAAPDGLAGAPLVL